jgi:hypothetical protein
MLENIKEKQPSFYHQAIIEIYKEDKDFWTYEASGKGLDKWNLKLIIFKEFYKHVIKNDRVITELYNNTLNFGEYFGMGEYAGSGMAPRMLP